MKRFRKLFRPEGAACAAAALALVTGLGAGLKAGRSSIERSPAREAASFKELAEVPLEAILADAAERGRAFGVSIGVRDLRGFVLQGMDAFSIPNLRAEARSAGEGPEIRVISQAEYREFKRTPYRCLIDGKPGYYTFLGKELAGASECWTLGVDGRVENGLRVSHYVWERLQWVDASKEWALFNPEQERRFYRAYIARRFGASAERRDVAESRKKLIEAGSDEGRRRSSLAAAYRTRARRAGALFRLEHL